MSFGDLLVELQNLQQVKGIKKALEKADEKTKHITVKLEDCVLTDTEFDDFMKENEYLIYEDYKHDDN